MLIWLAEEWAWLSCKFQCSPAQVRLIRLCLLWHIVTHIGFFFFRDWQVLWKFNCSQLAFRNLLPSPTEKWWPQRWFFQLTSLPTPQCESLDWQPTDVFVLLQRRLQGSFEVIKVKELWCQMVHRRRGWRTSDRFLQKHQKTNGTPQNMWTKHPSCR